MTTKTMDPSTRKAIDQRVANQAKKRHRKYIEELARYGVTVELPSEYDGFLKETR